MDILILGQGGREHALAWAIRQNPKCGRLIVAPGNPGIASVATCAALDILDPAAVVAFARAEGVGLVIVGPEAPLVAGVADALAAAGIPVLGPDRAGARLEASKAFTKEICDAAGVPTAAWARFDAPGPARDHVRAKGAPIVVKADGLAAGKGVVVAETEAEALAAVDALFAGAHGAAGATVVIEEFMPGEEASLFVLADGEEAVILGTAQDHKRLLAGDRGPNTGGMGAYAPAPVMTPAVTEAAMARIIRPVLAEMAARGTPYRGVLYAGLMIAEGDPRLVEFNVRFGDPEAQVLMLRMGAQVLDLILAAVEGRLRGARVQWADDAALCVVMAAAGYPGRASSGDPIHGLEVPPGPGTVVFHAGTAMRDGAVVTAGGRVLTVAARGADLAEARDRAYGAAARIGFAGAQWRADIGHRALGPRGAA